MKNNKSFIVTVVIALAILACLGITLFACFLFFLGSSGKSDSTNTETNLEYDTFTNPVTLVELSIDLENSLQLEDVRTTEVEGGVIEVRTKTPEDVSPVAILGGTSYIFGFVEPKMPSEIKTLRLIFTVNGLDASIIEVSRNDVKDWIAKKITDDQFVARMKRKSMI